MGTDQETLSQLGAGETLELDTLQSHLWQAADILRGNIDSSEYKTYIFGLLFLKRINDRFEEETEEVAAEHGIDVDRRTR
jgi:Type I restriction-modification system methyltransferase subunit